MCSLFSQSSHRRLSPVQFDCVLRAVQCVLCALCAKLQVHDFRVPHDFLVFHITSKRRVSISFFCSFNKESTPKRITKFISNLVFITSRAQHFNSLQWLVFASYYRHFVIYTQRKQRNLNGLCLPVTTGIL